MIDYALLNDARMIVNNFVQVKKDELVTIVTDFSRRNEAEALAIAVDEVGSDSVVIDMTRSVNKVVNGRDFWLTPPKNLLSSVQNSNVSIFTVNESYAFRLDHHVRYLFQTGRDCSIYKVDVGMGTWGLQKDHVPRVTEIGRKIMSAIQGHDKIRVTTKRGTDITLSIKGHDCLPVFPVPDRGMNWGIPVPLWGEYNWAPIEELSEGRVIIDGISEATPLLHVVEEPVEWIVRKGRIVEINGAKDAEDFRNLISLDSGAGMIGEIGIGGNPKALKGTETEKALLGTCHFGLGDNGEYPGGKNKSQAHVDGGVRNVTVEVDGTTILENGRLVI
jgi:leucyl aminopeptidase (aminopeptidase T)